LPKDALYGGINSLKEICRTRDSPLLVPYLVSNLLAAGIPFNELSHRPGFITILGQVLFGDKVY
jgi:hypothetical protein